MSTARDVIAADLVTIPRSEYEKLKREARVELCGWCGKPVGSIWRTDFAGSEMVKVHMRCYDDHARHREGRR